jgi:hypothetical protein
MATDNDFHTRANYGAAPCQILWTIVQSELEIKWLKRSSIKQEDVVNFGDREVIIHGFY